MVTPEPKRRKIRSLRKSNLQHQDNIIEDAGKKSHLFNWGSRSNFLAVTEEDTINSTQAEPSREEPPRPGEPTPENTGRSSAGIQNAPRTQIYGRMKYEFGI